MLLKYDFHLHSCLSPCGDSGMTPASIAGMAKIAGYDVVALSDHNSAKNCPAFLVACREYDIIGIAGVELNTREEVHVLCLFPDLGSALGFDEYVYERLPNIENKSDFFGEQLIMDEYDNIIGSEEKLLISAADIGVYEVSALLNEFGGVAIPAHMDRDSFSLLSNLGFYDRSLGFDVVEMTCNADILRIAEANPELKGMRFMVNSDAHKLSNISDASRVIGVESTSPGDIIKAIKAGKHIPELG